MFSDEGNQGVSYLANQNSYDDRPFTPTLMQKNITSDYQANETISLDSQVTNNIETNRLNYNKKMLNLEQEPSESFISQNTAFAAITSNILKDRRGIGVYHPTSNMSESYT